MQILDIKNYTLEDLEKLLRSNSDYIGGMRLIALIQIKIRNVIKEINFL